MFNTGAGGSTRNKGSTKAGSRGDQKGVGGGIKTGTEKKKRRRKRATPE